MKAWVGLLALTFLAQSHVARADGKKMVQKTLRVLGKNDEWVSADIHVEAGDLVIVIAEGKVSLGGMFNPTVGPNGMRERGGKDAGDDGILSMKVGTSTTVDTGARYVYGATHAGTLKFRVKDSNYADNTGSYFVRVLMIPASMIPSPEQVSSSEE